MPAFRMELRPISKLISNQLILIRRMHVAKDFPEDIFPVYLPGYFPVDFPGTPSHSVPANFQQRSRVWDFGFRESFADSQLTANQLQFLESATA